MKKLYKGLPFAFDDTPIISYAFFREAKTWELYFDEYYDIEKDESVNGYCTLSISEWNTILFKTINENADYQTIDEIAIQDLDEIAHLEFDNAKAQLKLVVFTKQSKFYDFVFTNAKCNLRRGKLLSEIDYHNVLVTGTILLHRRNVLFLRLDGFWNNETKEFIKQSCAIVFRYVRAFKKVINNNQEENDYSYMRLLNYEISQILDIIVVKEKISLTAITTKGIIVSIVFEDAYVTFYEDNQFCKNRWP